MGVIDLAVFLMRERSTRLVWSLGLFLGLCGVWVKDEAESLILAQNERWRRA
jgi:hypothetical protein